MKRPFRKCMGCYLHIRIVFELLSCKAQLPELWHFFQNQSGVKGLIFKHNPLEALVVALLFIGSWKNMTNGLICVRIRNGDHLEDAKTSKRDTSLRRI